MAMEFKDFVVRVQNRNQTMLFKYFEWLEKIVSINRIRTLVTDIVKISLMNDDFKYFGKQIK